MYTDPSFKTKKALKEAIAKGLYITIYQPNDMFNTFIPKDGKVTLEGPSFKPHTWYGTGTMKDGQLVRIK